MEVFFPSYGWIPFDPTPGVAFGNTYQEFVEQRSFLASLYRYSEYLRVRWNRYIVDYSREDQAHAIVGAFVATRSARWRLRNSLSQLTQRVKNTLTHISWREIGLIVGIAGVGILLMRRLFRTLAHIQIRFPALRRRSRATQKRIIRFYHIIGFSTLDGCG